MISSLPSRSSAALPHCRDTAEVKAEGETLALPAPSSSNPGVRTIDASKGGSVTMDYLGPVVGKENSSQTSPLGFHSPTRQLDYPLVRMQPSTIYSAPAATGSSGVAGNMSRR